MVDSQWFVQLLGRWERAGHTVLTTSSKSSRGSRSIQAPWSAARMAAEER